MGQSDTSEVLGTVRDASQSAIANATVVLTNQATGIEAKTTTDAAGNYDFFNVKLGTYTVTVSSKDFLESQQDVIAAKLTAEFDAKVPGGAGMTADRFVGQLYAQLKAAR